MVGFLKATLNITFAVFLPTPGRVWSSSLVFGTKLLKFLIKIELNLKIFFAFVLQKLTLFI